MKTPFSEVLDIQNDILKNHQNIHNHLGSIHAGALFTYAELASGKYLGSLMPDLKDKVIPLLRESFIKYKKQALTDLRYEAKAQDVDKFQKLFNKKNRATISVIVKIYDKEDDLICEGMFKWFIQKLDQK